MQALFIIVAVIAFVIYLVVDLIVKFIVPITTTLAFFLSIVICYKVYEFIYFRGTDFKNTKKSIDIHVSNCNELNEHIESLKTNGVEIFAGEYGSGELSDQSSYSYQRREWKSNIRNHRVHNCSATVCKNASDQPFKYLCKYFDIEVSEDSLSKFENTLNNFAAVEQGKILLVNERDTILVDVDEQIPTLIKIFSLSTLISKLGFQEVELSDLYFPIYTFQYASAGGKSSFKCDIKLDLDNLEKFINYLNGLIKFKKSIAGQRALMTTALRERIKIRDNFTCKNCDLSAETERNLLLEIDHIIPLSKGGITSEENLQTLCWKCNREKGAKIIERYA